MLFNFSSRYYYAIGLNLYLVLEVSGSQILTGIPTYNTQVPIPTFPVYIYVAITLYGVSFQRTIDFTGEGCNESDLQHHIYHLFLDDIRFELYRFRSPLLTISLLISFPVPTKMFQFGTFPIFKDLHFRARMPIRKSSDRRLLAPSRGLSQLSTSFIRY